MEEFFRGSLVAAAVAAQDGERCSECGEAALFLESYGDVRRDPRCAMHGEVMRAKSPETAPTLVEMPAKPPYVHPVKRRGPEEKP